MIKFFIKILCVVFLFNTNACINSYDVQEYVEKVTKGEDYNKTQESGDYVFKCRYKPSELLAIEELMKGQSSNQTITKESFEKEVSKFDNALYFDFTIALKDNSSVLKRNVSNQEQYSQFLSELTYNLGRDVCLIADEKDTIRPLTYNYSNNYGMAPDIRLLFLFSKERAAKSSDLQFCYDDKLMGISDKIKFNYKRIFLIQKTNIKFN